MRFAPALLLCGPAACLIAASAPASAESAEAQLRRVLASVEEGDGWKIAYENTLGGQKLRLPESFESAVRTKGARS